MVPVPELPRGAHRGLRFRLSSGERSLITDIFEYYWGPFIQGRITSLRTVRWFLARTFPRPEQLAAFPHGKAIWDGFVLAIYSLLLVGLLVLFVAVILSGNGTVGHLSENILVFGSLAEIVRALQWVASIPPLFWAWFFVMLFALWQVFSRCLDLLGILLRRNRESIQIDDDSGYQGHPRTLKTEPAKTLLGNLLWLLMWLIVYEVSALQMRGFSEPHQRRLALAVFAFWAFRELLKAFLVNFIGDIPSYLSRDEYAPTYPARRKVIDIGSELLLELIGPGKKDASEITIKVAHEAPGESGEDPGNSRSYDKVIVAGHSLGSVIGLDILRQTFLRAYPDPCWNKITHYLTFGSPLRKVSYLILQEEADEQRLRLDSFTRTLMPVFRKGASNEMTWWNFVIPTDPVADYLESAAAYSGIPKDITIPRITEPLSAHSRYWTEPMIYEYVCTALSLNAKHR